VSTGEVDDWTCDRSRIFVMHHVTDTRQRYDVYVAKQCVHAFVVKVSEPALLVA
jgi:hypothetical protein